MDIPVPQIMEEIAVFVQFPPQECIQGLVDQVADFSVPQIIGFVVVVGHGKRSSLCKVWMCLGAMPHLMPTRDRRKPTLDHGGGG